MTIDAPPENLAAYREFSPSAVETWHRFEDGTALEAMIYKPAGWTARDRRPAVMFFFGGGWRQGSPWQFAPYASWFAERGWVAVLPEYRVRGTHGTTPVDAVLDARAAMRWVSADAARLGIDAAKICAGGGSAGGHLAAALPVTNHLDPADAPATPVPHALFLFNPAVNFSHPQGIGSRGGVPEALGLTADAFATVDPHLHVQAGYPPTLIFHGAADQTVRLQSVESFVVRLKELGVEAHLVAFEGREHGFFNLSRGEADYRATLEHLGAFIAHLEG